jgi:hypothetical protein
MKLTQPKFFGGIGITALLIVCAFFLGLQQGGMLFGNQVSLDLSANNSSLHYTYAKEGVSFLVSGSWRVTTNEEYNLVAYNNDDTSDTVGFGVEEDQDRWNILLKQFDDEDTNSDKLIKKGKVTIDGKDSQYLVFARLDVVTGETEFEYAMYLVDTGEKRYNFSVSDPSSKEAHDLVKSIKFL